MSYHPSGQSAHGGHFSSEHFLDLGIKEKTLSL